MIFIYICIIPQAIYNGIHKIQRDSGTMVRARFEDLRPLIEEMSYEMGFDPALTSAIIKAESGFKVRAVSPMGAVGLMQVLPSTARLFGVRNPFDPKENIKAGLLFLRCLLQQFGNLELALAAYNAGPGSVVKYGDIPPYRETVNYVARVLEYLQEFKSRFALAAEASTSPLDS